MHIKTALLAASSTVLLALTGCSSQGSFWNNPTEYLPSFLQPYRAPVAQGNLITSEMVAQLEPGMSAPQVQYILGLPLLRDQFHPFRWDYVYYYLPTKGEKQLRRLTVWFNQEGRVDHWSSDPMPTEEEADQLILGNINSFTPPAIDKEVDESPKAPEGK